MAPLVLALLCLSLSGTCCFGSRAAKGGHHDTAPTLSRRTALEQARAVRVNSVALARHNGSRASSAHYATLKDPEATRAGAGRAGKGEASLIAWPGLMGDSATALQYYGGPVMANPITVYFILYGGWGENYGEVVLKNVINSLSNGSKSQFPSLNLWWSLVTDFTQSNGQGVSRQVVFGGISKVTLGYKKALGDGFGTKNDIATIVTDELSNGSIPTSGDAIYVVLTATDVAVGDSVNGFCGSSGYCGWHASTQVGGTTVKYALIGDPTDQCNSACGNNQGLSQTPNGFYSIDSMVSTILHEISEAATDPVLGKGWLALDTSIQTLWETADLCQGLYTDGAHPNMLQGPGYVYNVNGQHGLKYLVQTLPQFTTMTCMLQVSASPGSGGGHHTHGGHHKAGGHHRSGGHHKR